jgi:uncharacterized membrane protein
MPLWFTLSLTATFFWAIGYNIIKVGFKNISPLWNNIIANLLCIIFWLVPVLFLSNFHITTPNLIGFVLIFFIAIAYSSFPYAVSQGQISLSSALFSLYPVVTVVLSVLFLKEQLTTLQTLGIIASIFGCGCISWPTEKISLKSHSWILWGSLGAFLSGVGDMFVKVSTNQIGSYSNIFFMVILFNVVSVLNYMIDKKGRKLPVISIKTFFPTILAWCFILTGGLLFLLAFGHGPASLVSTVSATSPGLTAILAVIFLKEKLTKIHTLGIVSIIIGVILIGMGTV